MDSSQQQFMQCMEVWGGNQPADKGIAMSGLDAWVYSKPYGGSTGGGDVYYLSSCATNRILRLLIADVSGHGQSVDGLALELRKLMRRYVNHIDHIQFVRSMNEQFAAQAEAGLFATAVVSTYFAPTSRLTLCNAGHPPPLLFRSALGEWAYLDEADDDANSDPVNLPLGIMDVPDYQTFDVSLKAGDLVLCYTDSLVESRHSNGALLGQQGLLGIVRGVPISDPAALIPNLLAAVAGQSVGNLTEDDVTVLLIRVNGLGLRLPTLRQRAVAIAQMLGAIAGSIRPGGEAVPWPDLKLANVGGALFAPLNRFWTSPQEKKRR